MSSAEQTKVQLFSVIGSGVYYISFHNFIL